MSKQLDGWKINILLDALAALRREMIFDDREPWTAFYDGDDLPDGEPSRQERYERLRRETAAILLEAVEGGEQFVAVPDAPDNGRIVTDQASHTVAGALAEFRRQCSHLPWNL